MKKYLFLLLTLSIFAIGCEKEEDEIIMVTYDLKVESDLSTQAHVDFFGANKPREAINKNPYSTNFTQAKEAGVHIAVIYGNGGSGKLVKATIIKDGVILQEKTGTGSVDIQFVP